MLRGKSIDGQAILGLTAKNLRMLQEGHPIVLNLKELGCADQELVIFYEKDQITMLKKLREAGIIDDRTVQKGTPHHEEH